MAEKQLYFIAIVPDEPVYTKVMELKRYFDQRYNSRKALNSPPHVTLQMPFRWREDRETRIISMLKTAVTDFRPFDINCHGFGFFDPRVVYIHVEDNDRLSALQKAVGAGIRQGLKLVNELGERPFRPHMTIAFRDLRKPQFYEAKEEFEEGEFKDLISVREVSLLKHNGRHWEVYHNVPLEID